MAIVVVVYVSANAAYLGALGPAGLAASSAPAADALRCRGGTWGGRLIGVGVACSTFGILNVFIMAAARIYQAMAADGVFFAAVARLHPRTRVPATGIWIQMVWAVLLTLSGTYGKLLDYVVFGDWIFFGSIVATLFVYRRREGGGEMGARGFRLPGNPWVSRALRGDLAPRRRQLRRLQPGQRRGGHAADRRRGADPRLLETHCMKGSEYIAWAKSRHGVRYNLASSGVVPATLAELEPGAGDVEIVGPNQYGHPPLLEAIGARYGVPPESVVLEHGASMANHLAMATLLERGDEVLVEHPVYEPLHALPRFLGAEVRFFERSAEEGYALDPERVRRALGPRTRLVVISDLHNPTGALAHPAALAEIASLAEEHGFHLLVDEVYLEWLHHTGRGSAALLSPRVVATRSLTKAYGLDGLRAGWILAEPSLARRMRELQSLYSITVAHPSERLATLALRRAEALAAPRRALSPPTAPSSSAWSPSNPCSPGPLRPPAPSPSSTSATAARTSWCGALRNTTTPPSPPAASSGNRPASDSDSG